MKRNYEEVKLLKWEEIKIPKIINWGMFAMIFASIYLGHYYHSLMDFTGFIRNVPLSWLFFPVIIVIYIIIHELIHGIFMRAYSGTSPRYGFSGPFVFAKSDAYFSKRSYLILTLAPVIILGLGAVLLVFFVPLDGVWFVIFTGIVNLYASRGDLQAFILLKDLPSDLVIKDKGDSLSIYKLIE